jgi:hypothetical protein
VIGLVCFFVLARSPAALFETGGRELEAIAADLTPPRAT